MNILIAGSEGFIGSHCVAYFSGSHHVTGCDIRTVSVKCADYFCVKEKNDFEKILSEKHFDLFINASGSSGVGFSLQNPEKDYELNVANVRAMLEAVSRHALSCKFINLSSAAVYGNPSSLPVNETAVPAPLSVYGKNKLATEELLKEYYRRYGIRTASLRIFSAYGPGLYKQLFWDIYRKALLSKKVVLFGTGNESRDFIFISDLVNAIEIIAMRDDLKGECINVASGTETTIREAAACFLGKIGGEFQLEFSGETKEGDPVNWCADISILLGMGFSPHVGMDKGLEAVAYDYQSKGKAE